MADEGRHAALAAAANQWCESLIECHLFWALVQHPSFIRGAGLVHPVPPVSEDCRAQIFLQRGILEYRVDFQIVARGPRSGLDATVVEADGHDFHNQTRFQAERDRIRDRRLAAMGYRVLRFAGSEITRDADACADEVWGLIAHACGWEELP